MYRTSQDWGRCAISFAELGLPVSPADAVQILQAPPLNLVLVRCDFAVGVMNDARYCIGQAQYRRGVPPSGAPNLFDCSTFVRWIYGRQGIDLHRRSLMQRDSDGGQPVEPDDIRAGDLIFTVGSGPSRWWPEYPKDNVGHVAMATGEGTIIHANRRGVTEDLIEPSLKADTFRGIRRWVADPDDHYVFRVNSAHCITSSQDLMFLVLQNMKP